MRTTNHNPPAGAHEKEKSSKPTISTDSEREQRSSKMKVKKAARKTGAKNQKSTIGQEERTELGKPISTAADRETEKGTSNIEKHDPKDPSDARQLGDKGDAPVPAEDRALEEVAIEKDSSRSLGLSIKQEQAILQLTYGMSIVETAKLVGVDPCTIHRWRKNSFRFQAALNANKKNVLETAQSILVASSLKAAENVSNAILAGDEKLSVRVLERLGALSPPAIGTDDHITLGSGAVQEQWIKTISEDGLGPLANLLAVIEEEQGKTREGVEKLLEAGLEPDEGEEDDEVS